VVNDCEKEGKYVLRVALSVDTFIAIEDAEEDTVVLVRQTGAMFKAQLAAEYCLFTRGAS